MTMLSKTFRALICLAFLVTVAGCRTDASAPEPTPSQQPSNWPEKLSDFRFQWSAEPGTALDMGWAVPLRAYFESWLLTYYADSLDVVYPGFRRATPPPLKRESPAEYVEQPYAVRSIGGYLGNSQVDDPGLRIVGNERLHVLQLEPMATGFRAIVCDSRFGVYRQSEGESTFEPVYNRSTGYPDLVDSTNMWVWRIEFTDRDPRVQSPPPSPTAPQRGPLPAPRDDVFGPWFVTGAEQVEAWWNTDFPGLEGEADKQHLFEARAQEEVLRQQCFDWLGLSPAERERKATTTLDAAPQVEPATPGWPE
jgi:hypothetical protein